MINNDDVIQNLPLAGGSGVSTVVVRFFARTKGVRGGSTIKEVVKGLLHILNP